MKILYYDQYYEKDHLKRDKTNIYVIVIVPCQSSKNNAPRDMYNNGDMKIYKNWKIVYLILPLSNIIRKKKSLS